MTFRKNHRNTRRTLSHITISRSPDTNYFWWRHETDDNNWNGHYKQKHGAHEAFAKKSHRFFIERNILFCATIGNNELTMSFQTLSIHVRSRDRTLEKVAERIDNVAERSKAPDSRSVPVRGVGSNPTVVRCNFLHTDGCIHPESHVSVQSRVQRLQWGVSQLKTSTDVFAPFAAVTRNRFRF